MQEVMKNDTPAHAEMSSLKKRERMFAALPLPPPQDPLVEVEAEAEFEGGEGRPIAAAPFIIAVAKVPSTPKLLK